MSITEMYNKNTSRSLGQKPGWIGVVLILMGILGTFYPNLQPYIDKIKPVVEKIEINEPSNVQTLVLSESNDNNLEIPANADEYTMVKIKTNSVGKFYDLMVLTVQNTNIVFIEAVKTSNDGQWVFTGPPGRYSIRLSIYDPATGYTAMTGNVVIGKNIPVPQPTPTPSPMPTPSPTPTPTPNPTPNPQPPVIPKDQYGMTKFAYESAMKIASGDRGIFIGIADNFESVASAIAAGGIKTPKDANTKLQELNRVTLNLPGGITNSHPLYNFFVDYSKNVNQLNTDGKLKNIASDYADMYREVEAGLRLAIGVK